MLDWRDMERLRVLAGRAKAGVITADERREVRSIMAKGTAEAWTFAWDDLLHVAFTWLGFYALAKLGHEAVAAGA